MTVKMTPLLLLSLALLVATPTAANSVSCDSGNPANWLSISRITERLGVDGWIVANVEQASGCWKVIGKNPQGISVTGYFDPLSGNKLLVSGNGEILFRASR